MRRLSPLLVVILVIGFAFSAWSYDPRLTWRTIETEHFAVHYHEGERELALRAAQSAEQIYDILTVQLYWVPRGRIQIIVADDSDRANGWASTIPYNTTRLYATAPSSDQRIDEYEDWFYGLLMHELTHVIHIDQARGINRAFRMIFGRVFAINGVHPILQIEGLAVMKETTNTNKGRGRSTMTDMYLRAAVLADRFPTIDQSTTFPMRWPGSAVPYMFGGAFHVYVAEQYGEQVWSDISKRHSYQPWPFMYNHNAAKEIGATLTTLWQEWETVLRTRYERQAEQIRGQGLKEGRRVTSDGYQTRRSAFLDNTTLLYQQRSNRRKHRIASLNLDTGKTHTIALLDGQTGFDVYADDLIVYSDDRVFQIDYLFKDLFLIDLRPRDQRITSGSTDRLTKGGRTFDPAFFPDGRRILTVVNSLQTKNLAIYDLEKREMQVLTDFDSDHIQFDRPDVHPSSQFAAIGAWHERGNRDILLYDLDSGQFTRVTSHPGKDIDPQFGPRGRYLFFSSDRTGVYNIYVLDLDRDELFQVTNVLTGAFWPAISPDGSTLSYTGYTADGFDIFVMPLDRESWTPVQYDGLGRPGFVPYSGNPLPAQNDSQTDKPYHPWSTIYPRYWLPDFSSTPDETLIGAGTSGFDVLRQHSYSVKAMYGTDSKFVSYWLNYANRQLWPTLSVGHSRSSNYYGKLIELPDGEKRKYYESRISGGFGAYVPIVHHLGTSLRYSIQYRDNITRIPDDAVNPPNTGLFSGTTFFIGFNNTESYGRSISAERGVDADLTATWWAPWLGSDYDVRVLSGSVRTYRGLWYNHALAFRLAGGLAEGDLLRQRTFRLGGFTGSNLFAVPAAGNYFLRGYSTARFKGQRLVAGSAEYRFPIWWIDRGIGTFPWYFRVLRGSVFYDTGQAWDSDDFELDDFHHGVGAEIVLNTSFAYGLGLSFRFSVAQALNEDQDIRYIYNIGGLFF